jgi:ferredoxin
MSSCINQPPPLTIRVSKDLCCGAQLCAAIAPEIYQLDHLGYNASDGVVVTAGQQALAKRGMRACPEEAISLVAKDAS